MRNLSGKYCEKLDFQLVPLASHWVQQDAPDQVNRLLARFFADNSGGGTSIWTAPSNHSRGKHGGLLGRFGVVGIGCSLT